MYLTFSIHGTKDTEVQFGPISLSFTANSAGTGMTMLAEVGSEPAEEILTLPIMTYQGVPMAALLSHTLKIDRRDRTWSLLAVDGSALVSNQALPGSAVGSRQLKVSGGVGGTWLLDAVLSDMHPVFEDENGDDIPDDFEQSYRGMPESAEPTGSDYAEALTEAWYTYRTQNPILVELNSIAPDATSL